MNEIKEGQRVLLVGKNIKGTVLYVGIFVIKIHFDDGTTDCVLINDVVLL